MVSVIVPFVKDRGHLAQCLASIKMQSYQDFQLVIAQSPGSLPENFNNGLKRATGEFIKMVQDDDWLPKNGLEILVKNIHSSPWIIGNVWQECGHPYVWKPPYFDFRSHVEKYDLHMGSTLYRRDVLEAIGGMDETLLTGEEYDMHLKLLSLGYEPAYIDRPVYHYRMWSGGKSVRFRKERTEWRKNELEKIRSRYIDKI